MRLFVLASAICLLAFYSMGQTVRGRVVDAKGEAAPFATIALQKSSDSSLAKASLTDVEGNYLLENIKPGNYRVAVTMIGYDAAYSRDFEILKGTSSFEVPIITIKEASQLLGEVQIVEKKPMIMQEAGKTVVNVESSIAASSGLMAADVLKRTPGVVMDNDGNITLKGKSNVLLLIDGKPTYLSAKQAFAILKSIPSSQIASIEIITAPSAKYDAQGNAGVINIIMKKGFALGWNGNVHTSYGQGYLPKFNLGGGLSWGGKRFSFSTIYDFTANRDFNRFVNDRNFGLISRGNRMVQDQYYTVPSLSHTFRANADWEATSKLKLGVVARALTTEDRWIGHSTSAINDKNGLRLQDLVVKDNNPNFVYDIAGGANAVYKFDTTGHKISADVDISRFNQSSIQQSTTEITKIGVAGGTSTYDFRADLPTKVDIFTAKTDYTNPLTSKLNLDAGLKYVNIDVLSKIGYTFGNGFPTS
ncbi:MAG: carboxypeptidase regulatory-like domain-containing protein, partial [Cytophagales bacterium]|nr:carboxypeptidase regulatory-like domain-containing protein [Cytophagales bacterium]